MNISETIKTLPDDAKILLCGCDFVSPAKDTYVCSTDDIKRLDITLEKCETAIGSLSTGSLGFGSNDKTRWPLRDELLSEIREALEPYANPENWGSEQLDGQTYGNVFYPDTFRGYEIAAKALAEYRGEK